jgi:hypothetical protein
VIDEFLPMAGVEGLKKASEIKGMPQKWGISGPHQYGQNLRIAPPLLPLLSLFLMSGVGG